MGPWEKAIFRRWQNEEASSDEHMELSNSHAKTIS